MTNHPKKVVLLDLDGTLTQSDPGIIACVIKAFEGLGLPVPDDDELHRFIGPAIIESLRRNHVPEDMLDRGVEIYRIRTTRVRRCRAAWSTPYIRAFRSS